MLKQLQSGKSVSGAKQSRRALRDGRAARVFLAADADPALTEPLALLCRETGVPLEQGGTMEELGRAAGIQVGAAVVAVLRRSGGEAREN